MKARIEVEAGNTLQALQGFLRRLLEAGVFEALLVPLRSSSGMITPALVTDPALLSEADPLAPVLPVNSAALVGQLTARLPRVKLGAVLRSCELRALVELVKLQQASLEGLTRIAIDCAGAYSVPLFRERGGAKWRDLYRAAENDPEHPVSDLRAACQICEQPVDAAAEITIELFGRNLEREVGVSLPDALGETLGLHPAGGDGRAQVIKRLVAARSAGLEAGLADVRLRLEDAEGLAGVMADCLRCHNCMTVCPICYCKTCVFKSPIFDHEPMQYLSWARQKGALRLPGDTLLFHLTRLNHMALSCVGCGMCTEACPAGLPVGLVFRAVGQRLQAAFDYSPGRSVEDPLPLVTFKADEWTDIGD
jgi:formate dehydrogenase subunit beta